jgi:hypothetical protein
MESSMSQTLQRERAASPRLTLTLAVQVLALILTVGASVTAAYYTKGADSSRLTVLEKEVHENKADSLPRREFDAWRDVYMESVKKDISEIKDGIKEIRSEQLRDAQTRPR